MKSFIREVFGSIQARIVGIVSAITLLCMVFEATLQASRVFAEARTASENTSDITNFLSDFKDHVVELLPLTVVLLVLGVFAAKMVSRQISDAIDSVSRMTREAAVTELDVEFQIDETSPVEVRQLSKTVSATIGKLKTNIEQIQQLAYVDRTTRLPNREYFRKELMRAVNRCTRQQTNGAVLFVDLDGFKRVNDTYGHDVGDELLSQFSDRLSAVLRAEDLIGFDTLSGGSESTKTKGNKQVLARLGGDEFTVLLTDIRQPRDAAVVSQRIIEVISDPFEAKGMSINIGASIGIVAFPQDGSDYKTILKRADMAMYHAKSEGKNTFRFFSKALNEEAIRRTEIKRDLANALESSDQLELHYQPKICCTTGMPTSVEALVRWKHPSKGMIQPLEFIKIAEECGLILPLGQWVLEEACRQGAQFEADGLSMPISVNISTAQFEHKDLAQNVMEAIDKAGIEPSLLELELTESMVMRNPKLALTHIQWLKAFGVRFAIDDFGTGYSNLAQLSKLPFEVFKIDGSFIKMLGNKDAKHGRIIVRTILAMTNSLNYETVAEGVETLEQFEFLASNGCTSVQGFYFARPMPLSELIDWIRAWKPVARPQYPKVVKLKTTA